MKKYNKPTMKVHTCALSNEVLRCCRCGSGCCGGRHGRTKATDSDFEDTNLINNE